jgi:hypothetical protein
VREYKIKFTEVKMILETTKILQEAFRRRSFETFQHFTPKGEESSKKIFPKITPKRYLWCTYPIGYCIQVYGNIEAN